MAYMKHLRHYNDALTYALHIPQECSTPGYYGSDKPKLPLYWAGSSKKVVEDAYNRDMKEFWEWWERKHRPFHRTSPDTCVGPDIPEMERHYGRKDMSTEHIRRYPTERCSDTLGGHMIREWDEKHGNIPWESIPMHPYEVMHLAETEKICGGRQLSEAESKALKLFHEYQGIRTPKHPYEVAQQICDEEDKNMSDGISDARKQYMAPYGSLNPAPTGVGEIQQQSIAGLDRLATLLDTIKLSVAGGHEEGQGCEDVKQASTYKAGVIDRSKAINSQIQDLITQAEHIMEFL